MLVLALVLEVVLAQPVVDKPPLLARVVNDSNAAKFPMLSFKILHLTDLHYSGDLKYQCQDAPKNLPSEDLPCTDALMSKFVDGLLNVENLIQQATAVALGWAPPRGLQISLFART